MGLTEGDVLLKLQAPETAWPIELSMGRGDEYTGPDLESIEIPQQFAAMGMQQPRRRPWPSRDKSLTRMLKDIGEGAEVELTYLHVGQEVKNSFVIEQSPPDALSAAKYKDDELGLTVKDLTYEVRAALFLPEDAKGIVISKVEQGMPAGLARIQTFELIRALDGEDVGSVMQFEAMIKNAQEEDKESVRITVEWLGKTRLADLKIK
ncbi:MAG: PDZ domain-containing protein [Planctomycetes bacterium]|nr:PDZ domain-containing protein [Planctomycetota bacterium]